MIVAGVGIVGFVLGALFERLRVQRLPSVRLLAPRSSLPAEAPIRYRMDHRTATHEAGHALLAWTNPYTRAIGPISIEADESKFGFLAHESMVPSKTTTGAPEFYMIALMLGGLTGEMVEFGRFRSGYSRADLARARELAERVAAAGISKPPWGLVPTSDLGTLDFAKMFEGGLKPEVAQIFTCSYERARFVLQRDNDRFVRLTQILLLKGTLDRKSLTEAFGRRPLLFRLFFQ